MRLITKRVPMNFNLFLVSCTHWGSTFHHTSGWESLIEMVNGRGGYAGLPASANYVIHHGDMIEAIAIDDPRWSLLGCEPGGVIPQIDQSREKLFPIKDKLITVLQGNHEQKLEARYGNITAWVCKELGVPYGTYSSVISYVSKKDEKLLLRQYATHGHRGISSVADNPTRRNANMRLSLKRQLYRKAGDTYLMTKGHTHRLFICSPEHELYVHMVGNALKQDYTKTAQNTEFIEPDLRWYVNVGAFFKMYSSELVDYDYSRPNEGVRSSYPEIGEYDPIELGFAVALIRDGKLVDVNLEVVD